MTQLIPLPVRQIDPPPKDSAKLAEWAETLHKDYISRMGILHQDINRLSLPDRPKGEEEEEPVGHGMARHGLTGAMVNLATARLSMGLQLANGADRGKVSISFKYLGVGTVVIGSGATVTYTADLAVSGVNGLDTGNEAADTWYYVYMIVGEEGPQVDDRTANVNQPPLVRRGAKVATLLSTSAAPALPPGYNRYRRVGMVRNNGSSDLYRFTNAVDDDWFYWNEVIISGDFLVLNVTTSANTFTDVSCAAVVAPTSRNLMMNGQTTDADISAVMVKNKDHANVTWSATFIAAQVVAYTSGTRNAAEFIVGCDSAQAVQYRANLTTNDTTLCVKGYLDIR